MALHMCLGFVVTSNHDRTTQEGENRTPKKATGLFLPGVKSDTILYAERDSADSLYVLYNIIHIQQISWAKNYDHFYYTTQQQMAASFSILPMAKAKI